MLNRFDKKNLKIVVIATSSTIRGLIATILKELAFTSITTVSDIKTCIEVMETEPVDWVISPVSDANNGHALHIMNILAQNPALRATKVSILRDGNDSTIPALFEMGALSVLKAESSREAFQHEFQSFLHRVERYEGDTTRVAADYLSKFLTEKLEYSELKRFYISLLQLYPGRSDILIELARTHFLMNDLEEGKFLLQQLRLTSPDKQTLIDELAATFIPEDSLELLSKSFLADHFGFKTCLLLDADRNSLNRMEELMQKVGFANIIAFEEPLALLKWLRHNPPPDLILSEWQLPNIPGPVFLYKLRNRLETPVPIIIVNRQITERDSLWIKELDISCLVAKPVVEEELFQAVVWIMQQSKGPSDIQSLKTRLRILSKRQDKDLDSCRRLYMQHPMLLESDRMLMEAQLAYDAGCYLHAKKHALDAVKRAGDPREALDVLSRSLMKLREFDSALRCLENVTVLSPYNVTYLCEIAECHLENGDDQKFSTYLDQAKDIDPEAEIVIETEAKGAMQRGHTEMAKKLLQGLKSFKEVLAFMNNRAVALIQVGNHREGLDLYQKALASIPDGQPEVRSLLSYNLGLGYARSQRLKDADLVLGDAAATKNAHRLKKVRSLRARVQKAMEAGLSLEFPLEKPASMEDEEARLQMLRDVRANSIMENKIMRCDYCVYKIYRSLMNDSAAQSILKAAPAFSPRGKMVKDYMHGIKLQTSSFP